jgi:hypothetical protein
MNNRYVETPGTACHENRTAVAPTELPAVGAITEIAVADNTVDRTSAVDPGCR